MSKQIITILVVTIFLVSCVNKKTIFEENKKVLDSNLIVVNSPLTMPPYYALEEPVLANRTKDIDIAKEATRVAIFQKQNPKTLKNLSTTDLKFLKKAGYTEDTSNIKDVLNKEMLGIVEKDASFISKIFKGEDVELPNKLAEYNKYNKQTDSKQINNKQTGL